MREQIHLNSKRMSGRAVRIRQLDPSECAGVCAAAAMVIPATAKLIELKRKEWSIGSRQFITAYSEPCEDPTKPDVKWTKADLATLDAEFGEIFTPRDAGQLEYMYREYHELSDAEAEAIAGKALPVSDD